LGKIKQAMETVRFFEKNLHYHERFIGRLSSRSPSSLYSENAKFNLKNLVMAVLTRNPIPDIDNPPPAM
jgi:hypothetical protein